MYDYRKLSPSERSKLIETRRRRCLPWHSPPHRDLDGDLSYLLTASCYNHQPVIGRSTARLFECEDTLLQICRRINVRVHAWCVLPDHYHLLLRTERIKDLRQHIGRFHGRSSCQWNREDGCQGRQVWFNCFERLIKSHRHFWATLNYVHHNPVHHGYVEKWQDWLWSSAAEFIAQYGKDLALQIWHEYPLFDYGKKWDIDRDPPDSEWS